MYIGEYVYVCVNICVSMRAQAHAVCNHVLHVCQHVRVFVCACVGISMCMDVCTCVAVGGSQWDSLIWEALCSKKQGLVVVSHCAPPSPALPCPAP